MLIQSSNWRGPIWLAVNFLLIESLLRFYMFYGKSLQIECPTGSGNYMHLGQVAEEIQHRLQHLFSRGDDGRRAINDGNDMLDYDPHWRDYLSFHEFFDADTGKGLGASHQCGWTGLIAKMIHDTGYVVPFVLPSLVVAHLRKRSVVPTHLSYFVDNCPIESIAGYPKLQELLLRQPLISRIPISMRPLRVRINHVSGAPQPLGLLETEAASTRPLMAMFWLNRKPVLQPRPKNERDGEAKQTSMLPTTSMTSSSVSAAMSLWQCTRMSLRLNWMAYE